MDLHISPATGLVVLWFGMFVGEAPYGFFAASKMTRRTLAKNLDRARRGRVDVALGKKRPARKRWRAKDR